MSLSLFKMYKKSSGIDDMFQFPKQYPNITKSHWLALKKSLFLSKLDIHLSSNAAIEIETLHI